MSIKTYKKVLLIQPFYPASIKKGPTLQVGLGYISEYLNKDGVDTATVDMQLGYSFDELIEKINIYRPDLVGFTMMSINYIKTYTLITDVKRIKTSIPIVAGGPHISTLRETALVECPSIDFGVVMEGEITIAELCKGYELDEIKGLIYRNQDGAIKYNGNRKYIENINEIPFPTFNNFEIEKYGEMHPLQTSRGCPYECIYCTVSTVIGKKLRVRSPENILREIEYWYQRGKRAFSIRDDNFTFFEDRVYEICDLIEMSNMTGLEFSLLNGIRADKCTRDLLKRMKSVGFDYISFGAEAGNDKILGHLKKHEKIEDIELATKNACELDIKVVLFFLVGSPYETWKDVMDSVRLAMKYPVISSNFYNIIPFPGTELFNWVESNNYFLEKPEDYLNWNALYFTNKPVFQTPEFPAKDRTKALKYTHNAVMRRIERNYYVYHNGYLGRLYFIYLTIIKNKYLEKFFFKKLRCNRFDPLLLFVKGKTVFLMKQINKKVFNR